MDYHGREVSYIAGTPYWGAEMTRHAGPGGNYGEFIAWDAGDGKAGLGHPREVSTLSGALVTGSDLVFYGTVDGWFRAVRRAHAARCCGRRSWARASSARR